MTAGAFPRRASRRYLDGVRIAVGLEYDGTLYAGDVGQEAPTERLEPRADAAPDRLHPWLETLEREDLEVRCAERS